MALTRCIALQAGFHDRLIDEGSEFDIDLELHPYHPTDMQKGHTWFKPVNEASAVEAAKARKSSRKNPVLTGDEKDAPANEQPKASEIDDPMA